MPPAVGEGTTSKTRTALMLFSVAIGVAAGIPVALEASRVVSALLYGLKSNDPLTIAGAALLMVAAAALAGYFPARRASKDCP